MAKILVSGLANSGKTSLLQTLRDALVIANDGKKYPFKQPHINVETTPTADMFINTVSDGMEKYNEKFGEFPKTVVIDSISKVLQDIENHYVATITSFPYGQIGKDVHIIMSWIENELVKQGFNVIFVSHAIKDGDGDFSLVTAGGASGKRGGVIAEVDNALFVDVRGKKRVVYHKNPKLLSRSLNEKIPEQEDVENFNLQNYLEILLESEGEVDEWSL
jgi:hypothetical protein